MKHRLLIVLLAMCVGSVLRAAGGGDYGRVSLVGPGKGESKVSREEFVILVIEGPYIAYEKNRVPEGGLVEYVNNVLKARGVTNLAVYVREGAKYGDVMKAIDALRKTEAKEIGVSTIELAVGKEA